MKRLRALAPALLAVGLLARPALAHDASGAGFLSGLAHPVSGLDHVVAMIAVGLWGAQLGTPALWVLPVAFPLVMALGGFVALLGLPLPGVEVGIALSAIGLGALVLFEARPPLGVALAIVAVFAVFHGHAHGAELPEGEDGLVYSVGFVIGTGALHAAGIGVGVLHRWSAGAALLRGLGLAVAASGVWFLWAAWS